MADTGSFLGSGKETFSKFLAPFRKIAFTNPITQGAAKDFPSSTDVLTAADTGILDKKIIWKRPILIIFNTFGLILANGVLEKCSIR